MSASQRQPIEIIGRKIYPRERADLLLEVAETYLGTTLSIPVQVWRGAEPGPTLLVTGAVHGDEINGTGIVREVMFEHPFDLVAGTLILVPIVNLPGFFRHSRYMPDRRDLNRSFPGLAEGSLASRYAHALFTELIQKSDFALDLHTPAVRRTGFPNIRANLDDAGVARIAFAFGSGLVVNGKGPPSSLRRVATRNGCPTVCLEAGEALKFEPSIVKLGVRGIRNVLIELGMIEGEMERPLFQAQVNVTKWARAKAGGLLRLHVGPGHIVEEGMPLATTMDFLGQESNVLTAPVAGVVIGLTTLPAVSPGDPVCHIGVPEDGLEPIREAFEGPGGSLLQRVRDDLSTNVVVSEPEGEEAGTV